ncbi:MAG TPA: spheroidene monooxygenase [Frankiaceae bacterium]|nr:spheroidene monooxygenase [Frankiaceae bacterium]
MHDAPALVTFHLWGVARRHVPWALTRMVRHRAPLRRVPGLRFARLLGTGHGHSFTPRDADPRHWALLAAWDTAEQAAAFERDGGDEIVRQWDAHADERWRVSLQPVSSVGLWSGAAPFGPRGIRAPRESAAPCAVLTRARLSPRKAAAFWRATPPVAAAVAVAPGLRFARGIGEAPVGLQATFSVWDDPRSASAFAYENAAHRAVVDRTGPEGWYAEQLFARFAVIDASGEVDGRDPMASSRVGSSRRGQLG